jgi:hypothetical protein
MDWIDRPYPKHGLHKGTGLVVDFTSRECGPVTIRSKHHKVGEYSDNWDMTVFKELQTPHSNITYTTRTTFYVPNTLCVKLSSLAYIVRTGNTSSSVELGFNNGQPPKTTNLSQADHKSLELAFYRYLNQKPTPLELK